MSQTDLFAEPAPEPSAKPTTIEQVIRLLIGNLATSKGWEMMTPTRYGHMCEMLQDGVEPALVAGAESRINASRWLKKRSLLVTADDLIVARRLADEYFAREAGER